MSKKHKKTTPGTLALNRKARHDYTIETQFEAGLMLEGWEVKSIRAGRVQLNDSYVTISSKDHAPYLTGAHISPLESASSHQLNDPTRSRKLLLNQKEINQVIGATQQKGYTAIPLSLYWKGRYIKLKIAIGHGKKAYDKRQTQKSKDWDRQKQRLLKRS